MPKKKFNPFRRARDNDIIDAIEAVELYCRLRSARAAREGNFVWLDETTQQRDADAGFSVN